MLKIETFTVNPFLENTYLIYDSDTSEAIVIDPGFYHYTEQVKFSNFINKNNLKLTGVYCTHCHIDHICGANFIYREFGLKPIIPVGELELYNSAPGQAALFNFPIEELPEAVNSLEEKQKIKVGKYELQVISCPGHSPDHVVFYYNKVLIAGDVLFKLSIGRTDLPGGNYNTLINSIKKKIFVLPDDTVVYSGHGPTTTIIEEKLYNPFVGGM